MNLERGWKKRRDAAARRSMSNVEREDIRRQRALANGLVPSEPAAPAQPEAPEAAEKPAAKKPAK